MAWLVSPTKAAHVLEDLGQSDILIVNGDGAGACGVGIESTVAKIDLERNRILILRMGGVTRAKLRETLAAGGQEFEGIDVVPGSVAGGTAATRLQQDAAPGLAQMAPSDAEGQAPGDK